MLDSIDPWLIEKWRQRHALPDAVTLWASSNGSEANALAFNAIAQDSRVLQRAARNEAIRMAAQAEDYAQSLGQIGNQKNATWAVAINYVQHAITAWRGSLKAYSCHSDRFGLSTRSPEGTSDKIGSSTRPPAGLSRTDDPWDNALRDFPCVSNATGELATQIIRRFGIEGLNRARKPWDQLIALAVLRHAAQKLRKDGAARVDPDVLSDILTIETYATATGTSPMLVGYSGPGKPVAQALGLVHDARTLLRTLSAVEPDGTARSSMWQQALEFHAYAVVALDRRVLMNLPLPDAYAIAAAALRHADAVLQDPSLVEMPHLASGSILDPKLIRMYASACLPRSTAGQTSH